MVKSRMVDISSAYQRCIENLDNVRKSLEEHEAKGTNPFTAAR